MLRNRAWCYLSSGGIFFCRSALLFPVGNYTAAASKSRRDFMFSVPGMPLLSQVRRYSLSVLQEP
jgi:hypothetical protein